MTANQIYEWVARSILAVPFFVVCVCAYGV